MTNPDARIAQLSALAAEINAADDAKLIKIAEREIGNAGVFEGDATTEDRRSTMRDWVAEVASDYRINVRLIPGLAEHYED